MFKIYSLLNYQRKMDYKKLQLAYESAIKDVQLPSLKNEEKNSIALAYNNLGHSKYMQVKFDDAIEDYNKAIELDSSLAVAFYNRGTIHYRMGCYQDALKDLHKAVTLESSNQEFKIGLEECKKQLGKEA